MSDLHLYPGLRGIKSQLGLEHAGRNFMRTGRGLYFRATSRLPLNMPSKPESSDPIIKQEARKPVKIMPFIGFKGDHTIIMHVDGVRFYFCQNAVQKTFDLKIFFYQGKKEEHREPYVSERIKFGDAVIHLKPENKQQRKTKDDLLEALNYNSIKAIKKNFHELLEFLSDRTVAYGSSCEKMIKKLVKEDPQRVVIMSTDENSLCCFTFSNSSLTVYVLGKDGISERRLSGKEKKELLSAAEKLVAQTHLQRAILESLKKSLIDPS